MPASVRVAGAASKMSMYPDIIASSAGLTNWLVLSSTSVLQLPLLAQVKDDPGMGVATPLMSATTLFSVPLGPSALFQFLDGMTPATSVADRLRPGVGGSVAAPPTKLMLRLEIGRASCRERV